MSTPPEPAPSSSPAPGRGFVRYSEEEFYDQYGPLIDSPESTVWDQWPPDEDPEIPIERVWTLVEGDSGAYWAQPGIHAVNRIGYLVTTHPWPHTNIEALFWDGSTDQ